MSLGVDSDFRIMDQFPIFVSLIRSPDSDTLILIVIGDKGICSVIVLIDTEDKVRCEFFDSTVLDLGTVCLQIPVAVRL